MKSSSALANTTSVANLIKEINQKISNIMRVKLRNYLAQFLLNLSYGLSKIPELRSFNIP